MKILVINGPNLNMLGIREPEIYGSVTLADIEKMMREHGTDIGAELNFYQSNHEGDLVDRIQQAYGAEDGIIINAGAYSHTSIAILDALKAVGLPTVEVHISDPSKREEFRKRSYLSEYAVKTIAGKGPQGYLEALDTLMKGEKTGDKMISLRKFFEENTRVALAFSGGADSCYLLHMAREFGADVTAYFIKSQFQSGKELETARGFAAREGAGLTVIDTDVLNVGTVADNPPDRCYQCKTNMFHLMTVQAAKDGIPVIMDGSNASDREERRPGMRALREQGIRSPLREAGFTKGDVLENSRAEGIPGWDAPKVTCPAVKLPFGERLSVEKLEKIRYE